MQFSVKDVSLSTQHALAMFGATILIPMLMGLPPAVGLFCAGVGTLIYHFVTKGMIPIFLGSSAAYLAAFMTLKETMSINIALGAFVGASFTYIAMGILISIIGYKKIMKFLPHTVAGAVIIVLGISLVPIAILLSKGNFLLAGISAIAMIVYCSIDRGLFRVIPILLAIATGYVAALFFGVVDFSGIAKAPWFAFPQFITPHYDFAAIQIMAIIAIISMLEHIGDLTTNGMIVGKNHFESPGLHKSLFGNGLSILIAGIFGGSPTTTYGENNGVLAITKNYNPKLIQGAAVFAIALSMLGKFSALLATIPLPVVGGVSFILFGMIMMSGVNAIKESDANLMEFRHAAVIFIPIFIGIASLLPDNPLQIYISKHLTLSGLSLAALVGIGLNLFFNFVEGTKTALTPVEIHECEDCVGCNCEKAKESEEK